MGNVVDNTTALIGHTEKVRQIEKWVEELQAEGIDASYDVEFGRPEHGIGMAAKRHGSDLVVVTPRLRDGFAAILHPSITARMFSSVPAPILIVPERATARARAGLLTDPEATVVVPLDGSEQAERVLPYAVALADDYRRGMRLVRVLPLPSDVSAYATYDRPDPHHQRLVNEERRYMSGVQAGVKRATGLPADVEVAMGEPALEIVDIAAEDPTSLIVMSTHGHGALGRMLLGSVASEVAWQSRVPVLIVPPRAPAFVSEPATGAAPANAR
jgi:nucleotide-binding universal stress UspA family protein